MGVCCGFGTKDGNYKLTDDETKDLYDLYIEALKLDDDFDTITVPVEPLPGEEPQDTLMRWMLDVEILIPLENDGLWIDRAKAEAFDPNLLRFFDALQNAELDTIMGELEEAGYVYSTVDAEGNLVYLLTEAGEEYSGSWSNPEDN